MLGFNDLEEDECNINDKNDVTNDDAMFDAHRPDKVCICLSVIFRLQTSQTDSDILIY